MCQEQQRPQAPSSGFWRVQSQPILTFFYFFFIWLIQELAQPSALPCQQDQECTECVCLVQFFLHVSFPSYYVAFLWSIYDPSHTHMPSLVHHYHFLLSFKFPFHSPFHKITSLSILPFIHFCMFTHIHLFIHFYFPYLFPSFSQISLLSSFYHITAFSILPSIDFCIFSSLQFFIHSHFPCLVPSLFLLPFSQISLLPPSIK